MTEKKVKQSSRSVFHLYLKVVQAIEVQTKLYNKYESGSFYHPAKCEKAAKALDQLYKKEMAYLCRFNPEDKLKYEAHFGEAYNDENFS